MVPPADTPRRGVAPLPAVGQLARADAPTPDGVRGWFARLVAVVRRHPTAADAALGLLLFGLTLPTMLDPDPALFPDGVRSGDALGVALLAGMTLPLSLRRRWPVAVLVAVEAATIGFLAFNYADAVGTFGLMVALYSVGANCERHRAVQATAVTFVPWVALLFAGTVSSTEELPPAVAVANAIMWWGAFAVGDAFRSRRSYVAELQLRVDTADRLRQEEAAGAVAAERARIARELHDVVAHGMSVMVVQAGAARAVLDKRPDQADEALEAIQRTGREAMAEMRRLLGVLRDEAEGLEPGVDEVGPTTGLAPQPGVAALPALVASWAEAGMPVRLELDDELSGTLPAGVDLAAHRIVQEALTNVAKHAGTVHEVVVRLDRRGDAVGIDVTDDGRGAASAAADAGADEHDGHGLVGMRERAAIYGGEVAAGPRPGGGWRVRAELHAQAPAGATRAEVAGGGR